MTQRPVLELHIGERLELRKPHPCGTRTWKVVRLGADIGLVCDGCSRRVLIERRDLERQLARRLDGEVTDSDPEFTGSRPEVTDSGRAEPTS